MLWLALCLPVWAPRSHLDLSLLSWQASVRTSVPTVTTPAHSPAPSSTTCNATTESRRVPTLALVVPQSYGAVPQPRHRPTFPCKQLTSTRASFCHRPGVPVTSAVAEKGPALTQCYGTVGPTLSRWTSRCGRRWRARPLCIAASSALLPPRHLS